MTAPRNTVLRSLPPSELERLQPFLHRVTMHPGQVILRAEEPLTHMWFPESGAITRLVILDGGESVEAGTVGCGGVLGGVPLALGGKSGLGQAIVQIGGTATILSISDFEEVVRKPGSPLLDALLRYAGLNIAILCQLTACHCLHRVEQRLIRNLLALDDLGGEGRVHITHDMLAAFLGVHRPSVTYALQALAATGAIGMGRRQIALLNRAALLAAVCECYTTIKRLKFNPQP